MSCAFDKEKLTGYFDGELERPEKAEVEGHISACSECLRELGEIKSAATLVKALPRGRAPRSVAEGVSRGIAATGRVHSLDRFRKGLLWGVSAAAALLVVANVAYFAGREGNAPPPAVASKPPPVALAPAPSARRAVNAGEEEKLGGLRKEQGLKADELARNEKDGFGQRERSAAVPKAEAAPAPAAPPAATPPPAPRPDPSRGELKKSADGVKLLEERKPEAPAAPRPAAAPAKAAEPVEDALTYREIPARPAGYVVGAADPARARRQVESFVAKNAAWADAAKDRAAHGDAGNANTLELNLTDSELAALEKELAAGAATLRIMTVAPAATGGGKAGGEPALAQRAIDPAKPQAAAAPAAKTAPAEAPAATRAPAGAPAQGADSAGALRGVIAKRDADLADVRRQRESLEKQPASDERANRLAQLQKTEQQAKQERESAEEGLARLERRKAPTNPDEVLDQAFAAEKKEAEKAPADKNLNEAGRSDAKGKAAEIRRRVLLIFTTPEEAQKLAPAKR